MNFYLVLCFRIKVKNFLVVLLFVHLVSPILHLEFWSINHVHWLYMVAQTLLLYVLYAVCFFCFSAGLSTSFPYSREYHFVNQRMSWTEAQRCCRENFTDLVTIFNSDINELLMTMVQNRNDISVAGAWIGLYDNVYSWKWSMGDKSIYIDGKHEFLTWFKGQPNNLNGNQHCMVIEGTKELNDAPCDTPYPFLCFDGKKRFKDLCLPV